ADRSRRRAGRRSAERRRRIAPLEESTRRAGPPRPPRLRSGSRARRRLRRRYWRREGVARPPVRTRPRLLLQERGGQGTACRDTACAPEKGRKLTWAEAKQFARDVCSQMAADSPDRYLINMSKAKWTGKIFLDY